MSYSVLWLGAFAAGLIVLAIFVCISSIRVHVQFKRFGENDHLTVEIKALYNLIHQNYKIPLIQYKGLWDGIVFKPENTPSSDTDTKITITLQKLKTTWERLRILLEHIPDLLKWLKQTLSRLHCTQLQWHTSIGVSDAAETAISAGSIWAIKSFVVGTLCKMVRLDANPKISVIPQYQAPQFMTEAAVSLKVKTGWVLYAFLRFIIRSLRSKEGKYTVFRVMLKNFGELRKMSREMKPT